MTDKTLIRFTFLPHGADLPPPRRQTPDAAGYDLLAALAPDEELVLAPGDRALVPCGFALALPPGYEAQVRPRSGLAARHGVTLLNAPGTVDADYRGEVKAILVNHGADPFPIRRGDRIAQMVIARLADTDWLLVDDLDETDRGAGGFGSTGVSG